MPEPHEYWQDFAEAAQPPPWTTTYPAPMPDGSTLNLPIRDLGTHAIAGLIANQASFPVLDRLTAWLAEKVAPLAPDIILGLPTLGHAVAPALARPLGHTRWVPAGYSRKLWYDEALSIPIASVTTPTERRLWLDPRTLPLLTNRRILLVDDVISTGRSARAGIALLAAANLRPIAFAALMAQTTASHEGWDPTIPVITAFQTPRLRRTPTGWIEDLP
jgi:adenine/guanine phosphoribosyltransferase-like PRPP-binding protein